MGIYSMIISFIYITEICDSKCDYSFIKKSGDVHLIGLFPIQSRKPETFRNEALAWVEALIFNVNKVNGYLKQDVFGYTLYNTCTVGEIDVLTKAMVNVMLNSTDDRCVCTTKNNALKSIVGIVGPAESSNSMYVHELMSNYDIAIVSYSSTSVLLNNKYLYPNFFRTVPPDSHQSQFITDLLLQLNWKYVSLIAADNSYGRNGIDNLNEKFNEMGICVNIRATLSDSYDEGEYVSVLKSLKLDNRATVIIVWGGFLLIKNLLLSAHKHKLMNYTWILSEATGLNPWLLDFSKTFQGIILVTVQTLGYDREFEDHFLNISYKNTTGNPWLRNWFHIYGIDNKSENVKIGDLSHIFDFSRIGFIANAVEVLMNSYLSYREHDVTFIYNRTRLNDIIKKIKFKGFLNDKFSFDEKQNPVSATFQLYKSSDNYHQRFMHIAAWSSVDMFTKINTSLFRNVTSICSKECPPGEFAVFNENKRCCWKCAPCFTHQIKYTSGQQKCQKCATEQDYYANLNKTKCIRLKRLYWKVTDTQSKNHYLIIITLVSSAFCAIITVLYMVIFTQNRQSPVITSSNYSLSLIQQFLHLIIFTFPVFILGEESHIKCCLRTYVSGIGFVLIYALTVLKVSDFVTIFSTKYRFTKKDIFKIKSRGILIFTVVILTYIATIIIFEVSYPLQLFEKKDMVQYTISTYCDTQKFRIMHIMFCLIIFFAYAIQSFRGRKLPGSYNEAKYVGFALFSSILVKIISVVMVNNLSTQDDKIFLTGITVILSNLLILLILFSFRVYIIWFESEKNTQQYFRKVSLASIRSSASQLNFANLTINERIKDMSFHDESTPTTTRFRIVEDVDKRTNLTNVKPKKIQKTLGIDNRSLELIQECERNSGFIENISNQSESINSASSNEYKLFNVNQQLTFKEIIVHNRKLSVIKEKKEKENEESWIVVMDKDPDFSISVEAINIWNALVKEIIVEDTHT